MGYHHSTYFAYGIHIPVEAPAWKETDRIDKELAKLKELCPDVGHLAAGDYDRDMVFLVTDCQEIDLGKYGRANLATADQCGEWDTQLAFAVHALGYSNLPDLQAPGWLCIPDLS
jgi:hypothetical protein